MMLSEKEDDSLPPLALDADIIDTVNRLLEQLASVERTRYNIYGYICIDIVHGRLSEPTIARTYRETKREVKASRKRK